MNIRIKTTSFTNFFTKNLVDFFERLSFIETYTNQAKGTLLELKK